MQNGIYNEKVSNNVQFDFQQEIEYYCPADVNILREACLQYRNLTQSNHNGKLQPCIDVWKEITIASLCSQVYRSRFLEESWRVKIKDDNAGADSWVRGKLKDGVLCVRLKDGSWLPEWEVNIVEKHFVSSPVVQVPHGGYTKEDNYSKISIVWLQWIMEQRKKEGDHIFLNNNPCIKWSREQDSTHKYIWN